MRKSKTKKVPYYLSGIKDNVKVTVSDESLATATAKNGVLTIKAKKSGSVTITLEIENNGKKYTAVYKLNITDGNKTTTVTTTKNPDKTTKKTTSKNSSVTTSKIVVSTTKSTKKTTKKPTTTTSKKKTTTSKKTTTKKPTTSKTTTSKKTTTKKVTTKSTTTSKKKTTTTTKKTNPVNPTKPTSPTKPTNPTSPVKPTEPTKPTQPSKPTEPTKPVLSNNNLLSEIKVDGKLIDGFSSSKKEYTIYVDHNKDKISIEAAKQDSKATVKYIYNNKTYTNFNDVKISDSNLIEIVVTAENGDVETYKVTVIKNKNNDANLSDIKVSGFDLDKKFDKDTTSYSVNVKYNTNSINLSTVKGDSKQTVYINGEQNTSDNISLNEGVNEIEIKVVAEDGKTTKIYKVTVNKPIRTPEFNKDTPSEFKIENQPFNIGYEILEDGEKTDDYNLDEISIDKGNFKGEVKLSKDIIEVIPIFEDIGVNQTITLTYNGKTTTVKFKFTKEDYYLRLCEYGECKDEYDISFKDNKGEEEIILYTNILKDYEITKTADGIIIKNNKNLGDEGIITIKSSDPSVASIEFRKDENDVTGTSYVIRVIAHKVGNTNISINGEIYGDKLESVDVKIKVISEYVVILDANGGFFSPLLDQHRLVLSSEDELDLSKYEAYKDNSEVECEYFTLLGWSKDPNTETPEYKIDDVITGISENTTLYAIYNKDSEIVEIPEKAVLYLTELDLFSTKKMGGKLIAPGVESEGNHILTFENHSGEKMTIKAINLEEDTICVSENRCLNMGYILKNTVKDSKDDKFYYGAANGKYSILNKDANTTYTPSGINKFHTANRIPTEIEIEKGGIAEVTLFWKWVEEDDELDTEIGKSVTDDNNTYDITIWIEFEKTDEKCVINKE